MTSSLFVGHHCLSHHDAGPASADEHAELVSGEQTAFIEGGGADAASD
ncbi:MAG TPA: hypothetical protein VKI44_19035 [Acetobacteraceae bacterium]|nr:hypothetical protein [Acetobacteraceae bacterium]